MKTLIIDNGSTLTKKLALLSPGESDIVAYDAIPRDLAGYRLILLSGSSLFSLEDSIERLKDEIAIILKANIPLVGICFGHELIAYAFGGAVIPLAHKAIGLSEVTVVKAHPMFSGNKRFVVYENHQYGVSDVGKDLEILATTNTCAAIIRHKALPIYGFQFHPEHHTDQQLGDEIFLALFRELVL